MHFQLACISKIQTSQQQRLTVLWNWKAFAFIKSSRKWFIKKVLKFIFSSSHPFHIQLFLLQRLALTLFCVFSSQQFFWQNNVNFWKLLMDTIFHKKTFCKIMKLQAFCFPRFYKYSNGLMWILFHEIMNIEWQVYFTIYEWMEI